MLFVLEPAYVNEWGGGPGVINMLLSQKLYFHTT